MRRKLGIERQQIPNRSRGFSAPAKMPASRCHYEEWPKESGHVHPVRALESLLVFAVVEMVPERSEMHPARMIGIQLHRAPNDRSASLKIARVHDLESENPDRVCVQRVESHRALGGRTKRREILAK